MPEVRLIDANALLHSMCCLDGETQCDAEDCIRYNVRKYIEAAPTIDAKPVRHGQWKLGSKADNACVIPSDLEFYCTCCGKEAIHDYDDTQVLSYFCPNCGARMDGGADNDSE